MKFMGRIQFILGLAMSLGGVLCAQESGTPSKTKYAEVQIQDGGAIKGRVTFKGKVPNLTLAITQDTSHCSHNQFGMRPSPRLTVGDDDGVRYAVVYIKEIAQGKALSELKFEGRLDQKDCTYLPFVQVIPFKEKLTISNADPLNHNIHAKLGDKSLFNFAQPNIGELQKAITWPGVISMNCDVHAWMNAYIFSVRHPYYCVTDGTGAFELTNVPPGEYEVVAWHADWNAEMLTNSEGMTIGYKYGEPVTKSAKVKVPAAGAVDVNFVINE